MDWLPSLLALSAGRKCQPVVDNKFWAGSILGSGPQHCHKVNAFWVSSCRIVRKALRYFKLNQSEVKLWRNQLFWLAWPSEREEADENIFAFFLPLRRTNSIFDKPQGERIEQGSNRKAKRAILAITQNSTVKETPQMIISNTKSLL